MMRVTSFCPSFEDFGGVQHIVRRLNECMAARGCAPSIVTRLPGGPPEARPSRDGVAGPPIARVRFVRAPHGGAGMRAYRRFVRRFPVSALQLVQHVRRFGPDIVAAHCSKFYAPYVAVMTLLTGVPVVVHLHNGPRTADGPESPRLFRMMLRRARRIVACSPAVADYATANLPEAPDRVVTIPYGVDHAEFAGDVPRSDRRPFVLGVGRLAEQKGFDVLLEAFALSGVDLDLVLAGDGPDREHLAHRAARLGLDGRVQFLGFVDRPTVATLLRTASTVVIPSRFEGYPQTSLEAMLAGAPIIASAIPVMPGELRDGETGLLVPPEDAAALSRALRRMAQDPVRARALGVAARAAAEGFPSWETVTTRLLEQYGALTGGEESAGGARHAS
jgi:glycogen(starch) synthase